MKLGPDLNIFIRVDIEVLPWFRTVNFITLMSKQSNALKRIYFFHRETNDEQIVEDGHRTKTVPHAKTGGK